MVRQLVFILIIVRASLVYGQAGCKRLYNATDFLQDMEINSINGELYLSTWGWGLLKYDSTSDTFIRVVTNPQFDLLNKFVVYRKKILVANYRKGLQIFDPAKNMFTILDSFRDTNTCALLVVGNYLFAHVYDDGIYRTEDLKTWKRINSNLDKEKEVNSSSQGKTFSTAVTMSARNDTLFFFSGGGKMYLSTNYGDTWKLFPKPLKPGMLRLTTDKSGFYVNSFGDGLYYTDKGMSWKTLCNTGPCRSVCSLKIDGNDIYITSQFDGEGYIGGAYRMTLDNPLPERLWETWLPRAAYNIQKIDDEKGFFVLAEYQPWPERKTALYRCWLK